MSPSPKSQLRSLLVQERLHHSRGQSPILLTFDDGPTPEITDEILERLQFHNARALFFVLGKKAENQPEILRRIVAGGHELGNHTYSHNCQAFPNPATYFQDVKKCNQIIQLHTGQKPRFFRAPEGRVNPASLLAPFLLKMRFVLWSLGTVDWNFQSSADVYQTAESILERVGPGDIILMHDLQNWTVEFLDLVLPELSARNYDLFSGLDLLKK